MIAPAAAVARVPEDLVTIAAAPVMCARITSFDVRRRERAGRLG
ncbi:MAG TPA: hypothetical protein VGR91_09310 [Stellaceae bacterium]|nr:hypothetical protein [Stellaceae bacterium]